MTRTVILTLSLAISPTALAISHAQAPQAQPGTTRLMRFAGVLTDAAGGPLTGPQTVTFTLFDRAEGGTPLWSDTLTITADDRGRYAVNLGSGTPLPQILFTAEKARWIGTSVEGRDLGRTALVAVPYALKAADADTLGGKPAGAYVRAREDGRLETSAGVVTEAVVDGTGVAGQIAKWASDTTLSSSVISESASNRIGVGLPDPTGGGVVDSVFSIKNLDNNTGFAVLNQSQARRFALNTLASGAWTLYDGGSSTWNQGLTQLNGNVGLGTTAPDAKLKVVQQPSTDAIVANVHQPGRHAFRGASPGGSIAILGVVSSNLDLNVFSNAGVYGYNELGGAGVAGFTTTGSGSFAGVSGISTSGTGVFGSSTSGLAGHFSGNVTVTGTLSKGGGSFKIDHPLDPENKYLQHSFVESPDMMNVYNGNVTLDEHGEAWVTLPEWFEALNRDFRYQLTAIGAPGPNLYIASKVSGNRFKVAGGVAGGEVSWQVTGTRQDAWANAHRIPVEEEKPEKERGTYLHPDAFGQSVSPVSDAARVIGQPASAVPIRRENR